MVLHANVLQSQFENEHSQNYKQLKYNVIPPSYRIHFFFQEFKLYFKKWKVLDFPNFQTDGPLEENQKSSIKVNQIGSGSRTLIHFKGPLTTINLKPNMVKIVINKYCYLFEFL